MKAVICLCALVVVAIARPNEKYTSRYDHVDVKRIVESKRLLVSYFNCIMETGKCTPEGKELRSHLKEALETHCDRCTEKQKESAKYVIGHLINHEPNYWRQLCDKYDPDGKFAAKYEKELKTIA